jgi:hypothetical protein
MDGELGGQDARHADERRGRGSLLFWVLVPLLLIAMLEACGWASLLRTTNLSPADTRSQLSADYQPWPHLSFEPVGGEIMDEFEHDTGRSANLENGGTPAWFWPTPGSGAISTPTPFPSRPSPTGATATSIGATPTTLGPTTTLTQTPIASATRTSIPPPTQTPPPAPTSGPPGGGQQGTDQPNGNN